MNSLHRSLLAGVLAGLLGFTSTGKLLAGNLLPEGDLTVRVEELANGGVRISLRGTATVQNYVYTSEEVQNTNPIITRTNVSFEPAPPAFAGEFTLPLPEGLSLTFDDSNAIWDSEEETRSLFLPSSQFSVPLDEVVFPNGNWCLGSFEIEAPFPGTTITGSGSVTANNIPFSFFIPGTYRVGPPYLFGSPEESAEAGEPTYASGEDEYFITYEVIPFVPAPEIRIAKPSRFPATKVRRSAKSQEVTITNTGNMPLTNLMVGLSGPGARDFSTTAPRGGVLEPGESTRVSVGFRPLRKGVRRAQLTAGGIADMKILMPVSEEEGQVEQIVIEPISPIVVNDAVALEGTGVIPRTQAGRPNTPRFPRGPGGSN